MKRLAATLAALATLLASCSPASSPAATVDGTVITKSDVEALMYDPDSVVEKSIFANYLGAAIQLEILFKSAVEEYSVNPTEEEIAAETDRLYEENQLDQTREEFLEAAGISEMLFADIARQQLIVNAISAELETPPTQEEIDAQVHQAELGLAEVCASHILVATEEEANSVTDRLADGEEFADLAIELSIDTGSGANGGELGCAAPAGYVSEFAEASMTAEIGVPTEPVESQFGFHIILVTDRTEANPDDLPNEDAVASQLTAQKGDDAFNEWYLGRITAAEVTVEEDYGTWTVGPPPSVIPPE